MKLKTLFMSLLVVTLFSCNCGKKPEKEKEQQENEVVSTKEFIENYLIEGSSAGDFKVGGEMLFPKDNQNVKVEKQINTFMEEGNEFKEMEYKLLENAKTLIVLKADYDSETELASKNISDIKVFSDKFKTAQGIGVGATLDEFILKYPNYKIWYTYVSDRYVLDTEELENVQFMLNKNDFTSEIKNTGDIMYLKKGDFKPTTKIALIRIF